MTEKIKLSPSRINTYLNCGEQFRRRYILGEIIPPGMALIRGRSIHKGAEVNHKQKITSKIDLPKKEIISVIDSEFESIRKNDGFVLTLEEQAKGVSKALGEEKDNAIRLGGLYSDKVAPTIQPSLVEETITLELEKTSLTCRLDLATVYDDIVELKTGNRKSQSWIDNDRQMTFQSMSFEALTKRKPRQVLANVLVDNVTPVVQQLSSSRGIEDYEVLVNLINTTIDSIQKGVFMPCSESWWGCSEKFCGYYHTCKYVRRRR